MRDVKLTISIAKSQDTEKPRRPKDKLSLYSNQKSFQSRTLTGPKKEITSSSMYKAVTGERHILWLVLDGSSASGSCWWALVLLATLFFDLALLLFFLLLGDAIGAFSKADENFSIMCMVHSISSSITVCDLSWIDTQPFSQHKLFDNSSKISISIHTDEKKHAVLINYYGFSIIESIPCRSPIF